MKRTLVYLIVLCPALCFGADRFLLQTELRTNYSGGAAGKIFTGYTYDASGNRIAKRVFDGIDSLAALMSRELSSYDAQSRLSQVLLLSSAGDTLSIVRNTYGASGLICAATLNKNGSIRFIDSLIYTSGVHTEQRRYNSSATMTYFHRYAYVSGLLSADSMYESDGQGGFAAAQALIITRNADSTVSKEAQWRKSGDSWYAVGTTKMSYSGKRLLSAASYETDGVSGNLTDSLAYEYDANNNRIKETAFDNERVKEYDIVYTWLDTQPVSILSGRPAGVIAQRVVFRDNEFRFGAPFSGIVTLYTVSGGMVSRVCVNNRETAGLGIKAASGRYIAMINGIIKQSLIVTINN
jgi:hypothetical protein